MCSFCFTENVQSIINFSPRVFQHVFSYCNKSICYSCLQICNIWNWCRKHFVLNMPHKEKSRGVISGDRGGQGIGPSLPVHLFGNVLSKNRRTCEPQCGGAPSCWKIIHGWNSSNWGVPRSFLVISVCNQGKTLCSPCTVDGQNNGKSCETYAYLYYKGVGSPFACNRACILLGIVSYKFWIVSIWNIIPLFFF